MAAALKRPGLGRAGLGFLLGAGFGFGLVVALRAISGLEIFQTEPTGYPHLIVPAITGPLGFLVGLGAFDYWFRWAAGAPTMPEDHSQHGAKSWRDYFKFNTDHKVIGIQYIVTTFFFFLAGGLIAMLIRAELAQPGTQIVDPGALQRPLLDPRGADDLRLRDPGLRRDRQLRPAADDRGAGHGVPAPERALVLDAADGRPALPGQLRRPRRRLRRRLDRLRAALHRGPAGPVVLQPRASSSRAPRRSRRRSTSWSRSSPCARPG